MLKWWPYKKEYLLYLGSLLILILSYKLNISYTLAAWRLNNNLKEQLADAGSVGRQPGYGLRMNAGLNKALTGYMADILNFRNETISKVSLLAERQGIKLTVVPAEENLINTENYIIQQLQFEGDLFSLLRFLFQLEKTPQVGVPRSLELSAKAFREKQNALPGKNLVLTLYLEVLKNNNKL